MTGTELSDPQSRDRIKALLGRLALHLPPTRMTAAQFSLLIEDYLDDLARYPVGAIEDACNDWRKHGTPHFPKISDLIRLIEDLDKRGFALPKPWEPTGRWVALTDEGREKIQRGMDEIASRPPSAINDALLALGARMLASERTWIERSTF